MLCFSPSVLGSFLISMVSSPYKGCQILVLASDKKGCEALDTSSYGLTRPALSSGSYSGPYQKSVFHYSQYFFLLQRSRDSGGRDEGTEVKQQLGSLEFIRRVIDNRINRIDKGSETDSMGKLFNYF